MTRRSFSQVKDKPENNCPRRVLAQRPKPEEASLSPLRSVFLGDIYRKKSRSVGERGAQRSNKIVDPLRAFRL